MPVSKEHIDTIMKDPSAIYDTPHDVLKDDELTEDVKYQILIGWEEDVKALMRAESENMPNPSKSSRTADLLTEITKLRSDLDEMMNKGPAS
ncbi:MAG: hypothetical protein EP348_10985 [Alphaproteobacteria bacterium]|nr:MAG: hypothetical protein EP348_10985 [Alphaproteobacteria bacterium]